MTERDERLATLAAAGVALAALTDEQLEVFVNLSAAELSLLLEVKRRLDEVEPEVQAHATVAGAALF